MMISKKSAPVRLRGGGEGDFVEKSIRKTPQAGAANDTISN